MLKVVGASWLQTRISTYILGAVALLGIGAIILGEFGQYVYTSVENDGTYAATVTWKQNGAYRIDFWGQGNDLEAIPTGAARAYYRTGIHHTGWSVIEIKSSEDYPDTVQAYSTGLLEGSLTWQLIHHHWHNTIEAPCSTQESMCEKIRHHLKENREYHRKRAEVLAAKDPYWHMVSLFYTQLAGMEAGWKFAVRRSRKTVEIPSEDFLWLAMASDLPYLEDTDNKSKVNADLAGMAFLKLFNKTNGEPQITLAHNTAAPYGKMLRLLKRYDLGYHLSPSENSQVVPGRSIVMTSYPGALSSQDEYFIIENAGRELLVAGTPLAIGDHGIWSQPILKNQLMLAVRVMSANRLATDGLTWSRHLALYNGGTASRQWLAVDPRLNSVWLVEQLPSITHAVDYSKDFVNVGFVSCTGAPMFKEIRQVAGVSRDAASVRSNEIARQLANITTASEIADLMHGHVPDAHAAFNNFSMTSGTDLVEIFAFRGDLYAQPFPVGVIDAKIVTAGIDGIENFQVYSGPNFSNKIPAFNWTRTFPNEPHCGHPETFNFGMTTPKWVWV
ncbi:putative phospholipase B-like lamina ancestor isoform X1 [Neodiprion virginianus]|uniref:putative phospholipase B-like lamina ancestor isoform X1 n=1 Tax=Neodiprion virginianus TaxID=2961670 RepID=UPI001EE740FB|nr:putative phospholipase B-like lamina ancestor isoform X1 [Neodiprion virginianus]